MRTIRVGFDSWFRSAIASSRRFEHGDGVPRRIRNRLREELQEPGDGRLKSPDRSIERRPQVGSTSEEAHLEQVVDRFDEDLVVGVAGVGQHLDRTNEQAVRGVHIPVAVEQVIAARDRTGPVTLRGRDPSLAGRRALAVRCSDRPTRSRRCRQPGPIDGLGPPSPDSAPRPATSRPRRVPRRHGSDGRAQHSSISDATCFVRPDRGLGEMPGAKVVPRHARREQSMSAAPLVARRQGNDRRADQRMREGEARGRLVNLDDAGVFGRRQVVEPRFTRRRLQYVAGHPFRRARRATATRSSIGAARGSATRTASPAVQSAAVRRPADVAPDETSRSAMGSSSNASGLPCASATSRSRACGANAGNRCARSEVAAASSSGSSS